MNRQMVALLMAATMLLALAGCGEEKGSANRHDDDPTGSTAEQNDNIDNADNDTGNGTNSRAGQYADDNAGDRAFNNNHGSTFGGAGEAIQDDARTPETAYDSMTRQNANGMATWRQMLENGFVHDSDGFLLDGENANWS